MVDGHEQARETGRSDEELDPVDRAYLAQRFTGAPLILGVLALVTSVIGIGLLFGALGTRAGIDLWRTGIRSGSVVAGLVTSALGVLASIGCAIVWGAVLSTVLLGRDAIREAEKWRGLDVNAISAPALAHDGSSEIALTPSPTGIERTALLFVGIDVEPCIGALHNATEVAAKIPSCQLVIVAPFERAEDLRAFCTKHGVDAPVIGNEFAFPPPLARVAALPTLVIVDSQGRIESALVGAHPTQDVHKVMSGEARLPASKAAKK